MKIRSFLAFTIPDDVQKEIGKTIQLMAKKVDGMKWVNPERIHCTIKFFGDIDEDLLLTKISDAIAQETSKAHPLKLAAVGIGVFPNWRYPRVIWAGLTGDTEGVKTLHDLLEKAFSPFPIPPDERAFRLHLTLGRVRGSIRNPKDLMAFVERQVQKEFGEVMVRSLTLYRSVLARTGSQYTPLREFPLGGSEGEKL